MVRIEPVSSSTTGVDYMHTMDALLSRLTDLGITVRALCFDAASNTLRSLKLLQGTELEGVSCPDSGAETGKFIPAQLQDRVSVAHVRMPVFIENTHNGKPIFLIGDPAHHLKRDRNSIVSGKVNVFFENEVANLKWIYIKEVIETD